MAWIGYTKGIRYACTKLDNRLYQNVQDFPSKAWRLSKKPLKSGTIVELATREKKLSWGKNPEGYVRGRCAIIITICNKVGNTCRAQLWWIKIWSIILKFICRPIHLYIYIYIYDNRSCSHVSALGLLLNDSFAQSAGAVEYTDCT